MINCSWRSLLQQYFCNKTVLGQNYKIYLSPAICRIKNFKYPLLLETCHCQHLKTSQRPISQNLLSACCKDSKLIWIAQQILHCLKREHKAACFDPAGDGITLGYLNGNSSNDR